MPTPCLPRRVSLLALAGLLTLPDAARSAQPAVYTPRSGLALDGYDTVAYFTRGTPVRGEARFETEWRGVRWRFASQEHLEAFRSNPEGFAPQYGGYCAWAVGARNYLAPGDARHWRIVNDRLYVNYDGAVQRQWLRDIPGFIAAADRNWPGILTR